MAEEVLHRTDYSEMDKLAATRSPCPDGLLFLPYLSGERSPWHNPQARGVFFGLTRRHTDADMLRSVMEGIVLSLRCSLEVMHEMGIAPKRVVASGGGAKSALWAQMQADIYGKEIHIAENQHQASLGAAMMAAVGAGQFATIADACHAMVRYQPQITRPQPENAERYNRIFPLFKELYQANSPLFSRLAELA